MAQTRDDLKNLNQANLNIFQSTYENLQLLKINNQYWDMGSYLGPSFVSTFLLLSKVMNLYPIYTDEDIKSHQEILFQMQQSDGSWQTLKDVNQSGGDLNATIWNYLYLSNLSNYDKAKLNLAKKFIELNGGVDAASLFTKFHLALLGLYPYSKLPHIPEFVVRKDSKFETRKKVLFAQWVGPHLSAMYALRKNEIIFSLDSLKFNISDFSKIGIRKKSKLSTNFIDEFILKAQKQNGSWGGYTVATILNIAVLLNENISSKNPQILKALDYLKERYFLHPHAKYLGSSQDGRYWDTMLLVQGLHKSGYKAQVGVDTIDYLLSIQVSNGGVPFGIDFEYAPDVDDTAEWVLALLSFKDDQDPFSFHLDHQRQEKIKIGIQNAVNFILSMQNKDGGWGAFSLNNNGNFILKMFTKKLNDSVDLFDDSSVDVTAHAIEALAEVNQLPLFVASKALSYFESQVEKNGAWQARWGINYVYGTSSALVALNKIKKLHPSLLGRVNLLIESSLRWLLSKQNDDGGFGETSASYDDVRLAGNGASTPTQTALAIIAMKEFLNIENQQLLNAIKYLHKSFQVNQRWSDPSIVGTGHPGVLYMQYESYAWCFTLIALGEVDKMLRAKLVDMM